MTQSVRWILDAAERLFNGMETEMRPAIDEYLGEIEGLEENDVILVQIAYGYDPEPIALEDFVQRNPYGNPQRYVQHLEDCAERGWLQPDGEGSYNLTSKGMDVAKGFFSFADRAIGSFEPLPEDELQRIIEMLNRVVRKADELPEPSDKWSLSMGRRFDRGPSAPLMVNIRRRLLDLFSFRDDVHIAAWQPYAVNGHTWEALTYVWRGDAGTAAELVEKLPYRNYNEDTYKSALKQLTSLDWVAKENGKYVTTDKGSALRQEAEHTTDRYFDAPWSALSDTEADELKTLMEKLVEAVTPAQEEK